MTNYQLILGDCLDTLQTLPDESVQTCVTSPPYYGLRDYGHDRQIGLEETVDAYVAKLVAVFGEVRRVLRDDGTLWLNLGDSYNGSQKGYMGNGKWADRSQVKQGTNAGALGVMPTNVDGLKPKDLIGVPWRVAFALQADGWWLRSDIIWHKPNPMPESVTDRPTKAHEYIFLLSKSAKYFYDVDAVREPLKENTLQRYRYGWNGAADDGSNGARTGSAFQRMKNGATMGEVMGTNGRNKRSVWTVGVNSYTGAHFATFPEDLILPCIRAGSAPGDTVLDPFTGSGTTGAVAVREQRRFVGCELNPAYMQLAEQRIGEAAAQLHLFSLETT